MNVAAEIGLLGRVGRGTAGLALGGMSAFAELAYVVLTAPGLLFPVVRPNVFHGARALAELERHRLAKYFGSRSAGGYTDGRALKYLAARSVVGGLGAGIFLLILYGAVSVAIMTWQVLSGQPIGGEDPAELDWYDPITLILLGALLAFIAVQGLLGVATLDRKLATHFLGPTSRELLLRRLSFVTRSRADVVDAVNDERRRIERALHDGVQQRLVMLGMVLGRARRTTDPDRAEELLHQAHEEAQQALLDLREVAWRVYPVALDAGGLQGALEALAERSTVAVRLRCSLPVWVGAATETVAYFVVSEAMTNAIKHANASQIDVHVLIADNAMVVRVTDDGMGGAAPDGGGLSGLARRVAAADGKFTVESPAGGPTRIEAELPCE